MDCWGTYRSAGTFTNTSMLVFELDWSREILVHQTYHNGLRDWYHRLEVGAVAAAVARLWGFADP
jgi:hypothetical protein